ncbi:MAG: hypothetical protein L3J38_05890 [Thiomicrorhabdus sp.]|nr:hypothetical protein [Thiomicrorhabdus sp.]
MSLSDEKEREKLLKRFLPALVLLVVYFVFIKEKVNDELKVAEKQFVEMESKGISASVIPELQKRKSSIAQSVSKLTTEHGKIKKELGKHTQTLEGTGNVNSMLEKLSNYFVANHLHVVQEDWVKTVDSANLPKSFNAVKLWLEASKNGGVNTAAKAAPVAPATVAIEKQAEPERLREIQFFGAYQHVYEAMAGFANRQFNVIPVSISMELPEEDSTHSKQGHMKWVLKLWI